MTAPTDTPEALAEVLTHAQRAGMAHNGGAGGQYLLVATEPQLLAFAASLAAASAASLVAEPAPARRLAELVLRMGMVTENGKRARGLARRVLAGQDEALRHLLLIQHATAPTHDDDAYHESAHDLATAGIASLSAPLPASPAQPVVAAGDAWDMRLGRLREAIDRVSNGSLGPSFDNAVRMINFVDGNKPWHETTSAIPRAAAPKVEAPVARAEGEAPSDDLILATWNAWPRQGITSRTRAIEFVRAVYAATPKAEPPARGLRAETDIDEGLLRLRLGRAISQAFGSVGSDGTVAVDPSDSDDIDGLVDSVMAVLRAETDAGGEVS